MIETRDRELISRVINSFTRENENLVEQLFQLAYYFRGAFTRDDVFQLTPFERDKAIEFLNKRFKDAADYIKKSIPVFI